jgi:hypothetical protein
MKILMRTLLALIMVITTAFMGQAQNTRKDKNAAKEAEMKKILESKNFTFTAQSVSPMRGGTINLTSEYDVRVVQDSVISYLPYFGRAFVAPMNPNEDGMKFTSTKFSYVSTPKKFGYQIVIKPTDTKDVRQMTLTISTSGYGTLNVSNTNRDPISFYGYVEGNKKPKEK